jgi:hypothetical protein
MRLIRRLPFLVIAALVLALGVTVFSSGAGAQNDGWWIIRAEYGIKNQHNDVTEILKELIGRGGVKGLVAVNNQTMGGDPAVGADKTLRILARNARNEEREFNYREGSFVDVGMFSIRREERDDRYANQGQDQREHRGLSIVCAYYGVQGRTVNVTEFLRSRLRNDSLRFVVANEALGSDPAVGYDKILIVVYRYEGTETATAVREGTMLTLP